MAAEKFPGDEGVDKRKESADRQREEEKNIVEDELRKEKHDIDALRTEVVTDRQDQLRESADNAKKQEIYDVRQKIGTLKSEFSTIQQVKTVDYEHMTEDELADEAELGRAGAVRVVEQMVDETSFIPSWLKKNANT